jgi:PAS domain S-box-containing protein
MESSRNPSAPGQSAAEYVEERFRLLVDNLKEHAVFMIDLAGTITSWNVGVERVLGYEAEDFVGRPFSSIFTPEDLAHDVPAQELERARTTGRSDDKRIHVRKDGSRFPADGVVTVIRDEAGIARAFSKVLHDVSVQHRASAPLSRRDLTDRQRGALEWEQMYSQAQEANRLKDEFLGTVSHELRTPLNAILGWVHILETEGLALDPARRRGAIRTIARNAEIQVQLVDDLLDASRMISGKMRLHVRRASLAGILDAAVDAVRPASTAKNVGLRVSIEPSTAMVAVDPDRVQQIVWNLLSNAIKFTSPGGNVVLRGHQSDQETEIVVTDNGAGIPPDVLPFVFERFRQADGSTTRQHGGVGLGLAIVRHLVELHGGSVEAASEGKGRGSRFTVRLPASGLARSILLPAGPAAPPPEPDRLPLLTNVRVVVVDDDAVTRDVLSTVLGRMGAEVLAVDSTSEALAQIEARSPDIVIADIGMPGEDGYAFIQRLRGAAADRGGQAPAIALTAYARKEDRQRALAAGYQMHITKPFDPSAVVKAVAQLTSMNR